VKTRGCLAGAFVVASLAAALAAGLAGASASGSPDPFPMYPCQAPNVEFWKKVYSVYPTTQGILHDRRDLDIIYEVIPLRDPRTAGSGGHNEQQINRAKARYERVLKGLAAGKAPVTDDERRVRALFAEKGSPGLLRDAHLNMRVQVGQRDRFVSGLVRSGMYLGEIKRIIRQHGLPEDLAYLPHVESSFDYAAYSKFGAAGIWQFTHGTGKRFMTIDYVVDERRDPLRATHAAAQFLKENYNALGSWPLALTAYNHGTAGMLRAKRAKGGYEAIFREYDGPSFGFASRNFYSEFLAAREIARDHRRYFGDLDLARPVRTRTVTLPGYVRIRDLARHFQVDVDTLRQHNPSLREPVFRGQKHVPRGFQLRLPEHAAPGRLAEIPSDMVRSRQKPSRTYRVRKGDVAGQIARRHGVSLKDLIAANGLNARATVYAGQNLRIPDRGEKPAAASGPPSPAPVSVAAAPAAASVDVARPIPAPASAPPAPPAPVPEPAPAPLSVAAVSPPATAPRAPQGPAPEAAAVARAPAPAPTPVSVAAAPAAAPVDAARAVPAPAPSPATFDSLEEAPPVNPAVVVGNFSVEKVFTRSGQRYGVIRVEPEETLGHYADWLRIPLGKIRSLNRLALRDSIRVGRKIEIPLGKVSRKQFEERRYEYHKEMEEDFFGAYTVQALTTYQPEPGDTLWTLCQKKFDVPFWLLRKYNPEVDFDRLAPSRPLVVPVVARIGEEFGPAGGNGGAPENPS